MQKVELDERYLEILAMYTPKEAPKNYRWLSAVGVLFMLAGASLYMVKGNFLGISIAGIGLILAGINLSRINRFTKKAKQEFLDYVEKNEALPPYPEGKK